MHVLNVNQISKSFGDVAAVKNISFSAREGRIYGILGPNGAGKTTTIRMIMNIIMPDSGQIHLFNQPMSDGLKDQLGYLPEERGLYAKMTVTDMLVFLGELHGMQNRKASVFVKDWLEKMDLGDWRDKKVEELSKGMQQKIQFIATIMHEPDLIILDEPFSGLDPINAELIKNIMMDIKSKGKAIMFSTHVMDAAEKICDDILLIDKGEKILDGELQHIKRELVSNIIQIEYQGPDKFIDSLPMVDKVINFENYTEISLNDKYESQDLLRALVDKLSISRWQQKQTSLHDIFIKLVGGHNRA